MSFQGALWLAAVGGSAFIIWKTHSIMTLKGAPPRRFRGDGIRVNRLNGIEKIVKDHRRPNRHIVHYKDGTAGLAWHHDISRLVNPRKIAVF